jgi:hypothetical protein
MKKRPSLEDLVTQRILEVNELQKPLVEQYDPFDHTNQSVDFFRICFSNSV